MTGRTFFIPALLCRMNLLLVCLFVFALCRPVLSYPLAQGLAVSPLFHLGFSTEMEASVVGFLSVLPIKRLFITPRIVATGSFVYQQVLDKSRLACAYHFDDFICSFRKGQRMDGRTDG
jgi:hypothetical protein